MLLALRGVESPQLREAPAQALLQKIGADQGVHLSLVRPMFSGWGLYRVRVAQGRLQEHETAQLLGRLKEDPRVEKAQLNRVYRAQLTPNDDDYAQQWNLQLIGTSSAWDQTTGLTSQRIGVIDSGLNTNSNELENKDITGYDFIEDLENAVDGDGRDDDYEDDFEDATCGGVDVTGVFHGTRTSGVILASTDNNRLIAGLNWGAGLVSARVLGPCGALLSDIADAARWMAGQTVEGVPDIGADRVSVINISLGAPGACGAMEQDLYEMLAQQGVITVASAGNDGGDVHAPANCESVIAVAAHDRDRAITSYSNRGPQIEIAAPGGVGEADDALITPSGPGGNAASPYSGTSLAAAHITGAISLMQAQDPNLTLRQLRRALTQTGAPCTGCGAPALALADALIAAPEIPNVALEGEACDPTLPCDTGLVCAGSPFDGTFCKPSCDPISGDGCQGAKHCLNDEAPTGEAACYDTGNTTLGRACDQTTDCVLGAICVTQSSTTGPSKLCLKQCHHGFSCDASESCEMIGDVESYCRPMTNTEPPPPPPPPNEKPPEEMPNTECNLQLGNLDCELGVGCIDDGDGDNLGFCGASWIAQGGAGTLCIDRFECTSGLCEQGVCINSCDVGQECAKGYSCDTTRTPEGLCMPQPCAGDGECAGGALCQSTGGTTRVCALPRPASGCTHHRPSGANAWSALLALGGLVLLLARRRDRSIG